MHVYWLALLLYQCNELFCHSLIISQNYSTCTYNQWQYPMFFILLGFCLNHSDSVLGDTIFVQEVLASTLSYKYFLREFQNEV